LANAAQTMSGGRGKRHLANAYETPSGKRDRGAAGAEQRAPKARVITPSGGRVITASILLKWSVRMIGANSYENMFKFVKVMHRIV